MLHKTNAAALDWDSVPKDDPAAALEIAFRVANDAYGIQPLLDLEDILEAPNGKPDDKIIMTYLCFYFKEFSRHHKEQGAVKSITAACNITKRHDGWIEEYASGAAEMLAWDNSTMEKFSDTRQGAEGFGDTTAAIQEKHEAFMVYKKGEKPAKKTQMVTLGGLLSTLQASCRNNHRPIYEPAAEHSNDQIADGWSGV
jgi:hypothetical protein